MSEKKCTCGQTREAGEIPVGAYFKSQYKICEAHGIPRWKAADHSPRKITFDEFEDLLLKQIGEAFDMSREALFAAVDPLKPKLRPYQQKAIDDLMESFKEPQLIQGYTAENWQEIIDGGYLCEFSFSTDFERVYSSLLSDHGHDEHEGTHYFHPLNDKTNDFQYCRPAQIKGVMRPIFVEPVDDDDARCAFFNESGTPLHSNVGWGYRFGCGQPNATKYIEL